MVVCIKHNILRHTNVVWWHWIYFWSSYFTYIFISANAVIMLFVDLITYYVAKVILFSKLCNWITSYCFQGYAYKWYIGFGFFGFVLGQLLSVLVLITEFKNFRFYYGMGVVTIIQTCKYFSLFSRHWGAKKIIT